LDLVPGFGTSSDLPTFKSAFTFGFQCFFATDSAVAGSAKCVACGGLGITFIMSYILSYVFGTLLTLYATANLTSVIGAVPPVLATIFWFAFPSVNDWGGGMPLQAIDAGFNLGAIPLLGIGLWLYRSHEVGKEEKAPQKSEGPIELCFEC
jgi:hypothetical protein